MTERIKFNLKNNGVNGGKSHRRVSICILVFIFVVGSTVIEKKLYEWDLNFSFSLITLGFVGIGIFGVQPFIIFRKVNVSNLEDKKDIIKKSRNFLYELLVVLLAFIASYIISGFKGDEDGKYFIALIIVSSIATLLGSILFYTKYRITPKRFQEMT